MNLNDEDLKRFYRAFIDSRIPEDRRDCPSLEDLVAFFESPGRTGRKLKIIDHLTRCSPCAHEFEFLLELRRYQEEITGKFPSSRPAKRFFQSIPASIYGMNLFWRFSSVIVGMLLVIASLTVIFQNGSHLEETRAVRSSLILLQPASDQYAGLPLKFTWKSLPGAETYVLELYDEALLSVWESPEMSLTRLVLPPEEAERLLPGHRYFWMVTAFSEGKRLSESWLSQFTFKK
jgi:hypothetical protein